MTRKHTAVIISAAFILIIAGQSAQADWGVSFYGETSSPRYYNYSDRLTSEYRRGFQVDDWIERGSSSVTDSPVFPDGLRLSSWATRYEDDHDFGLATGIYFFEVPDNARSARIKIYYDGEADRDDFNGGVTGRVWIRRAYAGDDYGEYYPDEGRYEDVDDPLYGDTFVLRSRKHLEILRISADDHVIDGMMELHIVAEGRQRIDIKYVEVETYSYMPSVRVVTKYHKDYTWQPWYDYTYSYFYVGPTYHFADHYYVKYTYPRYRQNYVTVRRRYNDYLRVYYVKHPNRRVRWVNVARVDRGTHRRWDRNRINSWTREHDEARKTYVVTSAKKRRSADVRKTRTRVRSVLSSRSKASPAATRARSGIVVATPAVKRTRTVQTRSSDTSALRRRQQALDSQRRQQNTNTSSVRTKTNTSRNSARQTPTRTSTSNRTRSSVNSSKSNVKTRANTSTQKQSTRSVKQSPSRSVRTEKVEPKKRSVTRTRTQSSKSKSSTKKAPSKSTSTKKDDDEDDEEKKKKKTTTRSSSTNSSTTKRVRTRTR